MPQRADVANRNNVTVSGRVHGYFASGHCPNLSVSEETIAAIEEFLRG